MSRLSFKETLPSSDEYSSDDSAVLDKDSFRESEESQSESEPEKEALLGNTEPPSKRLRSEIGSDVTIKPMVVSSFLTKFLSTKKISSIPEPPEFPPMSDEFLREFNISSKAKLSIDHKRKMSITSVDSSQGGDIDLGQSSSDEEPIWPRQPVDRSVNLTLQLFNLPYTMTEKDVCDAAASFGVHVEKATILMDKKTDRPSGSATIVLSPPEHSSSESDEEEEEDRPDSSVSERDLAYAIECQNKLQEANFKGRPVRVRAMGSRGNRVSLGGGGARYFGGDISVKCHYCGEVGHRMADCPNDQVMHPCHLCAGTDHEPMNCTNIACHRCYSFGHHSRNCPSTRRELRPIVCTLCGSRTHDKRFCRMESLEALRKVEAPLDSMVCLSCGKTGHAMCLSLPALTNKTLFCPSCGREGHHIDYVKDADREPSCRNPGRTDLPPRRNGGEGQSGDGYRGSCRYVGRPPSLPAHSASSGGEGGQRGGGHSTREQSSGPSSSFPRKRQAFTSGRSVVPHSRQGGTSSGGSGGSGGSGSGSGGGGGSGNTSLSSRFEKISSSSSSGNSGSGSGRAVQRPGGAFSRGGSASGRRSNRN